MAIHKVFSTTSHSDKPFNPSSYPRDNKQWLFERQSHSTWIGRRRRGGFLRRNAASKVGDFRQILRGDDYVGRLDIHVNDTVGMNVMQPGDNVLHETEQSTWREGIDRGLDDFVQIPFASILHDDVDGLFLSAYPN